MVEATGQWIDWAIDLGRRLSTMTPADRASELRRQAAMRKITTATLRRSLASARYVDHHRKGRVRCVASAMAIESLMLLEKRAPARAAELRDDVFDGSMTARQLALEAEHAGRQQRTREIDKDWIHFARSICDIAFPPDVPFTGDRMPGSSRRSYFKVDFEVDLPGRETAAVYLSPFLPFSAMQTKQFSSQMTYALAAMACFDQVLMVVLTQEELKTFLFMRKLLLDSTKSRLRAIDHTDENIKRVLSS